MKKLLRILRSKSGFSLMELIVTCILVVMLGGGLALLTMPIFRVYVTSTDLSQSKLIASNVASCTETYLSFATGLYIPATEDQVIFNYNGFSRARVSVNSDSGHLEVLLPGVGETQGSTQIVDVAFPGAQYAGKTVQIHFTRRAERLLGMQIRVYNASGEELTRLDRTIRLLNTSLTGPFEP